MTTHIFISYSRNDAEFARRLALSLAAAQTDVWMDVEDIPAGMKWSTAVQQGLLLADVMVVVISPSAMQSRHVEDEWQYFLDMNKPVIPLMWHPAALHFQLARIQRVNFHHQPYNLALLELLTVIQRLGCEIAIPLYLEQTRRKHHVYSNAHPTHVRLPRPAEITRRHLVETRPKSRLYLIPVILALMVAGLFAVISQPSAQPPAPTSVIEATSNPAPSFNAAININVRAFDHASAARIGILRAGERAEILGVNSSRTWWYIRFEIGDTLEEGWISDVVIRNRENLETIPVMMP